MKYSKITSDAPSTFRGDIDQWDPADGYQLPPGPGSARAPNAGGALRRDNVRCDDDDTSQEAAKRRMRTDDARQLRAPSLARTQRGKATAPTRAAATQVPTQDHACGSDEEAAKRRMRAHSAAQIGAPSLARSAERGPATAPKRST